MQQDKRWAARLANLKHMSRAEARRHIMLTYIHARRIQRLVVRLGVPLAGPFGLEPGQTSTRHTSSLVP